MPQPIQELDPDFYISYNYPIDEKTKKVSSQSEKALYTFVEYLYDKGFAASIRPGDPTHLLIFIKLSPYKFIEEAEKDLIKNYEFGVTAKMMSLVQELESSTKTHKYQETWRVRDSTWTSSIRRSCQYRSCY